MLFLFLHHLHIPSCRSKNNVLLALLVSNNFIEVKGNVFKKIDRFRLFQLVCLDSIERVHLLIALLFVAVQTVLHSRSSGAPHPGAPSGPGGVLGVRASLLLQLGAVLACEIGVDMLKHAFISNYNGLGPSVYHGFVRDLCHRAVRWQSRHSHRVLGFVPLAPACVVLRILLPLLRGPGGGVPQAGVLAGAARGAGLAGWLSAGQAVAAGYGALWVAKIALGFPLQAIMHRKLKADAAAAAAVGLASEAAAAAPAVASYAYGGQASGDAAASAAVAAASAPGLTPFGAPKQHAL